MEGEGFVISTRYINQTRDTNLTLIGSSTKKQLKLQLGTVEHTRQIKCENGPKCGNGLADREAKEAAEKASTFWFCNKRLVYQILSQNIVQKIVS